MSVGLLENLARHCCKTAAALPGRFCGGSKRKRRTPEEGLGTGRWCVEGRNHSDDQLRRAAESALIAWAAPAQAEEGPGRLSGTPA